MSTLKHVIAYVTGGASGIGKAIAEKITLQGGRVVISDLTNEGHAVAQKIGKQALFTCTDGRCEKDVLQSIKKTQETFGNVNVLVNCAGLVGHEKIYDFKKCSPHSAELYKCVFDNNVWNTFNVTRLMVPVMAQNKPDCNDQRGVIINVSSNLAFDAPPGLVAYGAAKAAVAAMTLPLARELSSKGIRVNSIGPGYIDSPMTAKLSSEEREHCISMTLSPKRFGKPEEIAHLIQTIIENPLISATHIGIHQGWRYNQTVNCEDSKN